MKKIKWWVWIKLAIWFICSIGAAITWGIWVLHATDINFYPKEGHFLPGVFLPLILIGPAILWVLLFKEKGPSEI